jgi:uncharacterized protein
LTLFDPSPKSSAKDLYGREKELSDLIKHLDEKRWVILLGPRRIGKTSLAMCALPKTKVKKRIIVDAREESDFSKALLRSLSQRSRLSHLKITGGIGAASASIDISRDPNTNTSIGKLIDSNGRIVVLIDEAQWLRNPRKVSNLLAHIYDYHYDNATMIITGSAVGVMKSITEPSSKSPLYGRAMTTMEIQRWTPSESLGFLKDGLAQSHVRYKDEELSSVVERLDGIPGWLTLFGYIYTNDPKGSETSLRKTLREASRIVKDELENVSKLSLGWKRQLSILREISRGSKSFSEMARDLGINNTALSHNLDMLHRLGYVTKQLDGEYTIIDPMVAEFVS